MKYLRELILGTCLIVTACSDTKKMAPQEGRLSVLGEKEIVQSTEKGHVDKAVSVTEWTSPNANNRNKMPVLTFKKSTMGWKIKGAEGRNKNDLPMVTPAVIGDTIYTLDNNSVIRAYTLKDNTKIWQAESETKAQGVGLTADKNLVVTVDENGLVIIRDTKGKELQRKELKTPFRNTPLLANGNLFLLSLNNDFWVLNAKTGTEKWHYKAAQTQTLLQKMARPALADNVVIVPFSTGEVIGFDATTGSLLWSQDLVGQKVFNAVAGISQISASPVIENGVVYLVGHGGKTMAVNIKTGESLWQLDRGGQTTPFISGNTLFFVDNQNHLLALNKKSGKLFWEKPLEKGLWKGPYLIDEQLILFSDEKSVIVDPKTGNMTYRETGKIQGSYPALANEGVFFLGDNGTLYHWEKI